MEYNITFLAMPGQVPHTSTSCRSAWTHRQRPCWAMQHRYFSGITLQAKDTSFRHCVINRLPLLMVLHPNQPPPSYQHHKDVTSLSFSHPLSLSSVNVTRCNWIVREQKTNATKRLVFLYSGGGCFKWLCLTEVGCSLIEHYIPEQCQHKLGS
jgi:hypothetical protein